MGYDYPVRGRQGKGMLSYNLHYASYMWACDMTNSRQVLPRRRSGCPISVALEMLGDTWSLLIVRDLMFKGGRTYSEFMNGGEGIASNILANRLLKLEDAGIVEKRGDPLDARRFVYRLSKKGMDLAPVLVELVLWSARHEATDAPPSVIRAMRNDRAAFIADVRRQWKATG